MTPGRHAGAGADVAAPAARAPAPARPQLQGARREPALRRGARAHRRLLVGGRRAWHRRHHPRRRLPGAPPAARARGRRALSRRARAGHGGRAGLDERRHRGRARASSLIGAAVQLAERIGHPHAHRHGRSWRAASPPSSSAAGPKRARPRERAEQHLPRGLHRRRLGDRPRRISSACARSIYLGELGELHVDAAGARSRRRARGDLYAASTCRIRQLTGAPRRPTIPRRARRPPDDAMRHVEPGRVLRSTTTTSSRRPRPTSTRRRRGGDGAASRDGWRAVERSLFLHVQFIRLEALHLRGRATLLAAPRALPAPRCAAPCSPMRAASRRRACPGPPRLARLLRAGVAAQGGRRGARRLAARPARCPSSTRSTCSCGPTPRGMCAASAPRSTPGWRASTSAIPSASCACWCPAFRAVPLVRRGARAARGPRRAARRSRRSADRACDGRSSTSTALR